MNNEVPMTKSQKEIMKEFYGKDPTRVIFNKKEREMNFGNDQSNVIIE